MSTSRPPTTALPGGVELRAASERTESRILSHDALAFVALLARAFDARRRELLARREDVQARLDQGLRFDFLPETAHVRAGDWRVADAPADLRDRRVEITGPTDRKMIINALNSGASVFMADFEDSNAPTWRNMIEGQENLFDAVRRTITFESETTSKRYRLNETTATLVMRPRGWHLDEAHVLVDGRPVSASLFDFALYFFHNAHELVRRGTGPYFYLPKLESHAEARLWNDVFVRAQAELGLPRGTIRATVLIETLPAAFEMDEILHELREHASGLNCGRWDYIFSFIKKLSNDRACVMPDRAQVSMSAHFLRSYSLLLIETCHRRGAHAMGGMAAQVPLKNPESNHAALSKVDLDKRREARDGHDGTWVAHPALVPIARAVFDEAMPGENQIARPRHASNVTAADLLRVPTGPITVEGVRSNVRVGVQYLAAWLSGQGCVPLYGLMEDAATAEISRAQVWQQIRHSVTLDDGRVMSALLFREILAEELLRFEREGTEVALAPDKLRLAAKLFSELSTAPELTQFIPTTAYHLLIDRAN